MGLSLLFGGHAWAQLAVSTTYAPSGNYSVSWGTFQLGCTEYGAEWYSPTTFCYQLEEMNDGEGQYGGEGWVIAADSGTSITFTNRALGNYQYRIFGYWYGAIGDGSAVVQGPVSISVGDPNGPKPGLFATVTPIGPPPPNHLYDFLTWNAVYGASANSCKLRLEKKLFEIGGISYYDWQRYPGWLPTSGGLEIGKPRAWELSCTGPGGTTTLGGFAG
jgi:hypothetical protein